MPRPSSTHSKKAQASKVPTEEEKDAFTPDPDDLPDSPSSSEAGDVAVHKSGKKRSGSYMEEEDVAPGFGSEMQKMLECFGADISKTLQNKRKRLEIFTQGSLKTSNKRVEDIWKIQQSERQKLHDEFHKQVGAVFQQWQSDLDKTKDQEEKLTTLYKQQQKLFQQARIVQTQRLKTIRQLHEQYQNGAVELDRCHFGQQGNLQGELKKEMSLLQKKILMDTQQQEMATVKKSLQTMLF